MTSLQFKYAIQGLGHETRTLVALKKILVYGQKPSDVGAEYDMSRQRISRLRADIMENLERRLKEDNLSIEDVILTSEQRKKIRKEEEPLLKSLLKKSN